MRKMTCVGMLAVLGCASTMPALAAGGLSLLEIGTRDLGLAGAGYAARAEDASTALTNPAGMTRIKGSDAVIGAQLLYGNAKFSSNENTSQCGAPFCELWSPSQ